LEDGFDAEVLADDFCGFAGSDERAGEDRGGIDAAGDAEFSHAIRLVEAFESEFAVEIAGGEILGVGVSEKVDGHGGWVIFYMLIPPSTARTWPVM
jgi:hypothetical protein